jgi:predicted transcriptional regulator of viral defense system
VIDAVTMHEINRIFEVTDRLGIHREAVVIPLAPRRPGRVRRLPNGKYEIVADADFEAWLTTLETQIAAAG